MNLLRQKHVCVHMSVKPSPPNDDPVVIDGPGGIELPGAQVGHHVPERNHLERYEHDRLTAAEAHTLCLAHDDVIVVDGEGPGVEIASRAANIDDHTVFPENGVVETTVWKLCIADDVTFVIHAGRERRSSARKRPEIGDLPVFPGKRMVRIVAGCGASDH